MQSHRRSAQEGQGKAHLPRRRFLLQELIEGGLKEANQVMAAIAIPIKALDAQRAFKVAVAQLAKWQGLGLEDRIQSLEQDLAAGNLLETASMYDHSGLTYMNAKDSQHDDPKVTHPTPSRLIRPNPLTQPPTDTHLRGANAQPSPRALPMHLVERVRLAYKHASAMALHRCSLPYQTGPSCPDGGQQRAGCNHRVCRRFPPLPRQCCHVCSPCLCSAAPIKTVNEIASSE